MAEKQTGKKPANGALAMPQMPMQPWGEVYEPAKALKTGTLFPDLDKPFFMGGGKNGR